LADFEARLSRSLGLKFYPVTSQTYPRKQDFTILNVLSGIGASLYRFAFDMRLMQSPPVGEWSEPFSTKQVGSSAMPFKRNPIQAEKIDSLARLLSAMPQTAWQNAAHSLLERTLDDSANRRSLLPEACLICDELLTTSHRLVKGMIFNQTAIKHNLERYAPFAATERVMMALVRLGADRQHIHEHLRGLSLAAWEMVQVGRENPLADAMESDAEISRLLNLNELRSLLQIDNYTGLAYVRSLEMVQKIRDLVTSS